MPESKDHPNVYGHNQPVTQSTGEDLDSVREQTGEEGGGMGREGTPKDGPTEGKWHNDANRDKKSGEMGQRVEHAVDDHPEYKDTPMPPRHSDETDEVPS